MNTTRLGLIAGLLTLPILTLQCQDKPALAPLALSMRDAIRMALSPEGNPTVEIAAESVRVAEARRRESHSALLPQVDTTVGGQNQILNLSALGFGSIHLPGFSFPKSVGPFNTIDARVHVRQNVFDLASISRLRAGRAGIESAKLDTDDAGDQVAIQVAKLYLAAQRAASGVGPLETLAASAESTLKEMTNIERAGQALGIDVSHARVRLAEERQHVIESRMEATRAGMELLSALNLDLDTPIELTDPLAFTLQEMPRPDEALATALRSRNDVAAQRKKVQTLRLEDSAIRSERMPTVAGYANMGSLGTTVANSIGTYDVGLAVHIPVFDGGRRESRREETQSAIRQEELRATLIERRIVLDIRQALLKLEMARGQVEIAGQEIEVAQQELEHRNRRHEQGLGGQMAIFEAQASLARATDVRVAALYAWNEARIELMQAMGTIRSLAQ